MEKVKNHFENEAEEYDKLILTLIPYYQEMTDALMLSLPFKSQENIRVLDLGCGTGNISAKIKKRFPNARITCVDMADKMIKRAQHKLKNYTDISFKLSNFQKLEIDEQYDAIISSLALHHLENNEAKFKFYEFIYQSLKIGGVFYNADIVLGSSLYLQDIYLDKWGDFLRKKYSSQEVENKWLPIYRQEDRPIKMMTHLQWLRKIGFRQVDILWKYYNFAVYGGVK